LARAQIEEGYSMVTNQRHVGVELGDEVMRTVLLLLDGTRDRQTLALSMPTPDMDQGMIDRAIDYGLARLHHLNLLTG